MAEQGQRAEVNVIKDALEPIALNRRWLGAADVSPAGGHMLLAGVDNRPGDLHTERHPTRV